MKPDVLSAYASSAAAIFAGVALCVAAFQLRATRLEARRSMAHQIYKDYLKLAFENPQFSAASYPKKSPRFITISKQSEEYEQYEFFVSNLLFACEGILEVCQDREWIAAIRTQFAYHALYLKTAHLLPSHYSKQICVLVREAIDEYDAE
jgi:hypothetical protein